MAELKHSTDYFRNGLLTTSTLNDISSYAFSVDGKKVITGGKNGLIEVWSAKNFQHHLTIQNLPGLVIQGCDFRGLHDSSDLSERSSYLLRCNGAIPNHEDEKQWKVITRTYLNTNGQGLR